MATDKLVQSKKFLSPEPDEGSSCSWYVKQRSWEDEDEETGESKVSRYFDGDLTLRDCYKTICLDFSFHNPKDKKRRLKKLDNLIKSLQKFRDALEDAEL